MTSELQCLRLSVVCGVERENTKNNFGEHEFMCCGGGDEVPNTSWEPFLLVTLQPLKKSVIMFTLNRSERRSQEYRKISQSPIQLMFLNH